MSVKHTIRNGKGNLVEVELTPRKAIKKHCLECMCFVQPEVSKCTSVNCPLFPFRLGDSHSVSEKTRNERRDRMINRLKS